MEQTIMVPTIHLNGTSRSELIDRLLEAGMATNEAMTKLKAAWPNGRDYYVQNGEALRKADGQWQERMDKLLSVYNDLIKITQEIDDQWTIDNV